MRPRIFISAVTGELGASRSIAARVLQRIGYDAIWQDIFGTEAGDLRQMLRKQIDQCDGLLHLVGRTYGAEPPQIDPEFGRVSYTQFEFLYARRRAKRTWVLFMEECYPSDKPLEQLDLPIGSADHDPTAYQAERRALQFAWREQLRGDSHLWHTVASTAELELKLERLRDDFRLMRRQFRLWQWVVTTSLAGIMLLGASLWWTTRREHHDIQRSLRSSQNSLEATIERLRPDDIRSQLRAAIEAAYREGIQQAEEIADPRKHADAVRESRATRDAWLEQSEDYLRSRTAWFNSGDAPPEFSTMMRTWKDQGVDGAIEYVAAAEPRMFEQARSLPRSERRELRDWLSPILDAARLQLMRGDPASANERCDRLLEIEPDWGAVLHEKFLALTALGNRAVLYDSLSAAIEYYRYAAAAAARAARSPDPHPRADRDVMISHYNLGRVNLLAARLSEAAEEYRKYLKIAERLAADAANEEAMRDLSVAYAALGDVSLRMEDLADAIEYYRKDLEIAAQAAREQPSSRQSERDWMVASLHLGEALRADGQLAEAIRLFQQSKTLAEKLANDSEDLQAQRDLSMTYERLGSTSSIASQRQAAIAYYRKYLDIAQRLWDSDASNVAAQRDLAIAHARLGEESLKANALDDALAYYRRYLELAELPATDAHHAAARYDLWSAHTRLGHIYSRRGDVRQAIAQFEAGQRIADAELAKNSQFFSRFDRACYAAINVLKHSLEHPHSDESANRQRAVLIEAAMDALRSLTPKDLSRISDEPDFSALVHLPEFKAVMELKSF